MRTTDSGQLAEAIRLHREGVFDYVELYVVPGTFAETIDSWSRTGLTTVLHAPHSGHGVNLARADLCESNRRCYEEVKRFADRLRSPIIIAHAGNNGSLEEAARQIVAMSEPRLCIENKPAVGLDGEVCIGSTPEEVGQLLAGIDLDGFVLDFGHAVYAANTHGRLLPAFLGGFAMFRPVLFHLSDGEPTAVRDMHLNLFDGDFSMQDLLPLVPEGSRVTLETPRRPDTGLADFARDVQALNASLGRMGEPAVFLREAVFEDASMLLDWRNAPATRKASRRTEVIDPMTHRQWLRDTLAGDNRRLYVAMQAAIPVGTVRTDRSEDGLLELSWTVAPDRTGCGVGKRMVALLVRHLQEPLRTEIRAENTASIRIAEHAGLTFRFRRGEMLHFARGPQPSTASSGSGTIAEEAR